MNQGNVIIKDLRILTPEFIPSRILHREGEIKALRDNLEPLVESQTPRNTFAYGPPGTGKTCISQFLISELKSVASVQSAYVNCWMAASRFKILYNIAEALGSTFIHRKGTPTDELIEILKGKTQKDPVIIVLDEVDMMEDLSVLYDLTELKNICLILISNTESALFSADPRILSRLQNIERIEFKGYSEQEITDILWDRASLGLVPNAITKEQVKKISSVCCGDARKGINILRAAAEEADRADTEKILDNHIEKALPKTGFEEERILDGLNSHQKILYMIVKSAKELSSANLYSKYFEICSQDGIEPLVERSVRHHIDKLLHIKLISSIGEGRWTMYKLKE